MTVTSGAGSVLSRRDSETAADSLARELEAARARIAELEQSVANCHGILETAHDLIWRVDEAGRVLYVNGYVEEFLGFAPADALGRSVEAYLSRESAREVIIGLRKALFTSSPAAVFTANVEYRHRDGRLIPAELRLSAERDARGHIVALCGVSRDVTLRKRADLRLIESEERFRRAVKSSPFPIIIHAEDGEILAVSEGWTERSGYSHADIPTIAAWTERAYGTRRERAREVIEALYGATERREEGEFAVTCKDGATRYWEFSAAPLGRLLDGRRAVTSMAVDVTARKQAEDALRASEARYHTIVQTAMDGFWLGDTSGRILDVNDAYCRMSGYSATELLTMRIADLEVVEDDADVAGHMLRIMTRGEDRFETRHRRKDGTVFDVEVSVQHRPADGKVVAFLRDLTPSKQADERLRKLSNLVPGVIYQFRLHPDGRSCFPYASPGINDIYEVTPEEVLEDATIAFGRIHPDDVAAVSDAIFVSAGALSTFHSDFRVVLPRQGLRWRSCDATPERLPDGGTLWHGIITDVTERKRAEEDREDLEAQFRQAQKMESVGRLAGGVAHDFNNMLAVILGNIDLVLEQVDPASEMFRDLDEVREAGRRSADLTRQLLAFARKQVISPVALDLNATVAGMLSMLRRLLGEDVQVTWAPGRKLWLVNMDPSQVDQVLANLCVNARDAIVDVGTLTIETRNTTVDEQRCVGRPGLVPGEYVVLVVRDDGCGMDMETLSHLFEPFFTTKELGKGTGLGLATVYGVVKQNNGYIDVTSEPGFGTTFTIYLPRLVGTRERTTPAGAPVRITRGHETILLVEDEPTILRMTARMLEKHGYTVLGAGTPAEAIRLATEHGEGIDLMMTDVVMPGMNGLDLSVTVRAIRPSIQRLFMSGYTADVIARHGVLDGDLHFLQKPFSPESLFAAVRGALDAVDSDP